MSIDINWETITSGPDGEALAESIRSFVHDKFQQVTLPGFIRSVEVHSFDFGKISPQLEIKDIGDPLPDFYDGNEDDTSDGGAESKQASAVSRAQALDLSQHRQNEQSINQADGQKTKLNAASVHDASQSRAIPPQISTTLPAVRSPFNLAEQLGSPFPRSGTPGIPGGTSNLSYFHLPLGGLSGTQTPLAVVASGTNFSGGGWSDPSQGHEHHNASNARQSHADHDSNSPTRPSTAVSLVLPHPPAAESGLPPAVSPHLHSSTQIPHLLNHNNEAIGPAESSAGSTLQQQQQQQQQPSDLQVITHVRYAGDIRLTLTAQILLDYPMPSFVGIPLKLSITGLTFDGVAVLASIKKNLHFCFLAPEDAEMLVGRSDEPLPSTANENENEGEGKGERLRETRKGKEKSGGLLEEIRVESEIGRKENGKQVLKNVGKVERFVLEQIRRIFEDEFVFPSFWTFLV